MEELLNTNKQYYDDLVKNLNFDPSSSYEDFIKNNEDNYIKKNKAHFVISYYFLNRYCNLSEDKVTYDINIAKFGLFITIKDLLNKLNSS